MFSWNSLFDGFSSGSRWSTLRVSILVFLELALRLRTEAQDLTTLQGFNPCFPGTRSSTWKTDEVLEYAKKTFQSLFSWNSLFDFEIILYVPDDRIQGFNPCFPGTRSSTVQHCNERGSVQRVSILVFLELALRLPDETFYIGLDASFNPCFPGTRSSTLKVSRSSSRRGVSILVFLELALRPTIHDLGLLYLRGFNPCFPGTRSSTMWVIAPPSVYFQFQSLFSWNSLFDTRKSTALSSPLRVSILVFLELALRPCEIHINEAFVESFNPCFPGTRSSTLHSTPGAFSDRLSFNPCFPGTRSSTCAVGILLSASCSFNPCFPGTRSSTLPPPLHPGSGRDVSILVFLELALRQDREGTGRSRGSRFQSLFSWNSLFDTINPMGFTGELRVSILVFLELALRPFHIAINPEGIALCFNPCFPGTRSSTLCNTFLINFNTSVSILVFLELALRLQPGGVNLQL